MQLNKFTDYGLRLLMFLLHPSEETVTIAHAAEVLKISENHLVKVTHFMAKQGWIISTRGKGGGIRIHPDAYDLPVGDIVRALEHDEKIVNCMEPPCVLRFSCNLRMLLQDSLEKFYQDLNRYTLKDALHHSVDYSLNKDERAISILNLPSSPTSS